MIALLLSAAAVPPVAQAERAFASMAQTKGQWTAFRAFAAPDAQMMLDGPQPAAPFLKDRKDPPAALMWWPMRTVTSCDGSLALSTGPWRTASGRAGGRFFTIWRHDAGGWHWIYDGGTDATATEAKDGIVAGDRIDARKGGLCRKPVWPRLEADARTGGSSEDDTLRWRIDKMPKGYRLRVMFNPGKAVRTEADVIVG